MTEKTVQVPVSLIEQISDAYDDDDEPDRFAALLEQLWTLTVPNPTAEPPRIEDMAPVATHSSGKHRRVRLGEGVDLPVCDTCTNVLGLNVRWDHAILRPDHDPSTIRDVTPPSS